MRNVHGPAREGDDPGWSSGWMRQRTCGLFRTSGRVAFVRRPDGAGAEAPGQVTTCGNVWACPVCAHVIKSNRAELLKEAAKAQRARGGDVVLVTLTLRHQGWHDLHSMRTGLADAYRRLVRGAPWKRFQLRHGVQGYVRAMEVTRSAIGNGWHPHLHVLLFTSFEWDDEEREDVREWLSDRWRTMVCAEVDTLGPEHEPSHERGVRVSAKGAAATYLSKLGLEVAGALTKHGSDRGRQPWELLLGGVEDAEDRRLWRQYVDAMRGTRQLTWSRYIRADLGLDLEDDADERGEVTGAVPGYVWDDARRRSVAPALRAAASRGVWELVAFVAERWGAAQAAATERLSLEAVAVGLPPRLSSDEKAMRAAVRARLKPAELADMRRVGLAKGERRIAFQTPQRLTTALA